MAASIAVHALLLGSLPQAWETAAASLPQVLSVTVEAAPVALQPTAKPAPARGLPGPRYLPAEELDRRPLIQSHVEPHFPALALAPTGRVVLRLYVGEDGRVERIAVESGDPTGAFEAAARQAFASARFLPGMKGGVAVKSLLRIEVLFGSPHPDNG